MKTRMLAVVVCLVTVAAFGQSNPKLKELQTFVGTWHCTGTTFASPMGPEHPTVGNVTGEWTLNGSWVEVRYTETKTAKNPHPYAVRMLLSYDEEPKAFVSGAVDNMSGYSIEQAPGWMTDKMTFTGKQHGGGATINVRETFTRAGKDEVRHESEMEMKGKWVKLDQESCKH
ncbi:MAG TPA: DUF1579 family protein [Thermoanaerobaculia bacterium]|jgi:hypothetical protein|nr:DUF1579 family protein [Thermoanaerobaculia bacterium]